MSGEKVNRIVYEFLRNSNRPYSINDIFEKLGQQDIGGKSTLQKALDCLVKSKEITEKVYGKQKIYTISQNGLVDNENLRKETKKVTDEQTKLNEDIKTIEIKIKNLEILLKTLISTMTTNSVEREIENLELSIISLNMKLIELKKDFFVLEPDEKINITKNYQNYLNAYKKRKKLTMEMLDGIMEGYPKTKKHLIDDTEIETDEMVGFVLNEDTQEQ